MTKLKRLGSQKVVFPVKRLLTRAAGTLPPRLRQAINIRRGIDTPTVISRVSASNVAVVAPHPDDEIIGVGGSILLHVQAGEQVAIVHLTSGERTAGLAAFPASERPQIREAEALEAAKQLGVKPDRVHFARFADGAVSRGTSKDAAANQVEKLVSILAPLHAELLYVPWPIDAHRDHVATAYTTAQALPDLPSVTRIALYEVWSPITPTHIVDITKQIDHKIAALKCYKSALIAVDYAHTARGLAAYRSAQGLRGAGYGEAFCILETADFLLLMSQLN